MIYLDLWIVTLLQGPAAILVSDYSTAKCSDLSGHCKPHARSSTTVNYCVIFDSNQKFLQSEDMFVAGCTRHYDMHEQNVP